MTYTPLPCILAMDTATGPCSVAVWKDGKVAAYAENIKPVMQSASLIPMIEQALKESAIRYADLTAIAATIGPGSFTGIRVALAAARAICFASNIPGMGYTTLEVLAYAASKHTQPTLTLLNAGKGEHYYQYYSHTPWKAAGEPQLGLLSQAFEGAPQGGISLSGNGQATDPRFTPIGVTFPRADILAELAATHPHMARSELTPFYIRAPDAKLPQKKIL